VEKQLQLRATHSKSKETRSLPLEVGQNWSVGRFYGVNLEGRWNLDFDPALSREHFEFVVQVDGLKVRSTANRHPILVGGKPSQEFEIKVGERFFTAHTAFEFFESIVSEGKSTSTEDLDRELDLLSMTAMLAVLVNGGQSFGRTFSLLVAHHGGWLRPILQQLEASVVGQGEPLSKALTQFPEVFSEMYLAMVELGEVTNLGRSLNRLYEQLAKAYLSSLDLSAPQREAHSAAYRTIAEVLDGGGSEHKAVSLAARVCQDAEIRSALEQLTSQLSQGHRLADCKFPRQLIPWLGRLVVAHDGLGTLPRAFRNLADLMTA